MYKNSLAELDTLKAEKEKMKNRIEEILAPIRKSKIVKISPPLYQ